MSTSRRPYRIAIDPPFRSALREVSKAIGPAGVERYFDSAHTGKPAAKLLTLLYDAYTP